MLAAAVAVVVRLLSRERVLGDLCDKWSWPLLFERWQQVPPASSFGKRQLKATKQAACSVSELASGEQCAPPSGLGGPVRPARDLEIRKSKCRTLVCLAQTTGKHHLQVTIPILFHLCKSICYCPIERTPNQLCTTQLQQVGHCSGSQAKNGMWKQNSRCQSAPIGAMPQLIYIPVSMPAPVLMPPRSAAQ